MSNDKEDFALHCPVKNEDARKRLGIKAGFFWTTAKKLSVAVSRCIAAMDDKGYDEDDFKKPVRVNLPAIGDLPPEGAFDTEFCNRYEKGGEDGKTMMLIPGAVPADQFHGEAVENTAVTTDTPVTDTEADSDDSVGDPLPAYAYNVNGELMSDVEEKMLQPVASMSERHRILSQFILEGEFSHRITPEQLSEVSSLELDVSNSYIQDMLLACHNVPGIQKLDNPSLWKFTDTFKRIFPQDKRHTLHMMMNFAQAYADAHPIDRTLLAKEWQKGNRVSYINKPEVNDAPEPQKTKVVEAVESARPCRSETPTFRTINYELACGFYEDLDLNNLRPAMDFAKRIIAEDREDWKRMSMTVGIIPDIKGYDRQTIIDLVRKAPKTVHNGNPDLRQTWCESFLAVHGVRDPDWYEYVPDKASTTHEENLETVRKAGKFLRDIEAGRYQCDEEKPQPAGELANEPATSEAVEQDTTEHNQNPQQVETESSVADDGNQALREKVSKQLAAGRGDFVPGISAPSDPKWVHNDYSASNEGEKTEVATDNAADAADFVDHSEAFSNQPETVADQNEPETPETEPEVSTVVPAPQPEWPTYFEYGRYEGLPNCAYHAADGISSTMLKDARISLMYFYGRYIAGTIKRETSDAFTMGSLVHSLILEPAKFDEEYAVFPGIPAGAFTNTDSLKAFIREYNADKPKSEQLKLTGKKEDLQEAIRAVKPEAIFADEYEQQWLENIGNKTVLTGEQLRLAKAMQQAVLSDSVAGYYVNYPSRSVEVSYFGMDEDTEMDVRVRPDLEITVDNERIGIDLKTISMGRVRQDVLRARLHREIIDRDYHISAAMYSDVANLNKFFWIFVNKDEGYHWVAVVEASSEEIELGRLEYRKTMQSLKQAYDSGVWPAPITEQYTDNLNDYDLRRLEMLSGLV